MHQRHGVSLDPETRTIAFRGRRSGVLPKRAYNISAFLFEHFGDKVATDALKKSIWSDKSYVTDHTINTNVWQIRRALRDVGAGQLVVERSGADLCLRYQAPGPFRRYAIAGGAALVAVTAYALTSWWSVLGDLAAGPRLENRALVLALTRNSRHPSVSPDGRRLAFVGIGDGRYRLEVMDLLTGRVSTVLETVYPLGNVEWFPGGRRLAYLSNRNLHCRIDTIAIDGTDGRFVGPCVTLMLDQIPDTLPLALSIRGGVLGYAGFSPAGDSYVNVTVLDIGGGGELGNERQLRVGGVPHGLRLSPDGRRLLYIDFAADANLVIMDLADPAEPRQVTRYETASVRGADWLDADTIVHVVARDDRSQTLRLLDLRSGAVTEITGDVGHLANPVAAGDGRSVYFERQRPDRAIAQVDFGAEGAVFGIVEDSTGIDTFGDYDPRRNSIVFASDRGGQWRIYRKSLADSVTREIARVPGLRPAPLFADGGATILWKALAADGGTALCSHDGQRSECRGLPGKAAAGPSLFPAPSGAAGRGILHARFEERDDGVRGPAYYLHSYRSDTGRSELLGLGQFARLLPDGRLFRFTGNPFVLRGETVDGAPVEQPLHPVDYAAWSTDGDVLAYVDRAAAPPALVLRGLADGRTVGRYVFEGNLRPARFSQLSLAKTRAGHRVFLTVSPEPTVDLLRFEVVYP